MKELDGNSESHGWTKSDFFPIGSICIAPNNEIVRREKKH